MRKFGAAMAKKMNTTNNVTRATISGDSPSLSRRCMSLSMAGLSDRPAVAVLKLVLLSCHEPLDAAQADSDVRIGLTDPNNMKLNKFGLPWSAKKFR